MARRQVLFIQGGGAGAHDNWDDKLVDSLSRHLGDAYEVLYPHMPNEDEPSYVGWSTNIWREMNALHDDAIGVGHSVGGTILINALSERRPQRELSATVLIGAPFVGAGGWPGHEFELRHDLGRKLPEGVPVHVFTDWRTRLPRPRTLTYTPTPFRRHYCTDCLGRTISSTMT